MSESLPEPLMAHRPLEPDALRVTLTAWQQAHPDLGVLALLPEAESAQVSVLQGLCRELRIPLIGAIFPALVTRAGFVTQGVWLLCLERMQPAVLIERLNAGPVPAAERLAAAVRDLVATHVPEAPQATVYLLFDGMVPNISSILDALFIELGDLVAIDGATAGSETFQPIPCLFDGERLIGDGVLCFLMPGTSVTVLEHGFTQPERAVRADFTDGNRIARINGRPAFEVYQELIRAEYGIDLTQDNFYQHAVHYPFGVLRGGGFVIRIPVAVTDDGSIHCVGEVPQDAALVLLKAPPANNDGCIDRLVRHLERENGVLAHRPLLTFYCAGRRMHLGAGAEEELAVLNALTHASVFGGALSLGEIGDTQFSCVPQFHNATLVCTPWAA